MRTEPIYVSKKKEARRVSTGPGRMAGSEVCRWRSVPGGARRGRTCAEASHAQY